MSVWADLLLLGCAGVVGGLLNACFAHEGFVLWRMESLPGNRRVWRPGFLGNMLVGGVTAVVMATLYSPLGAIPIGMAHTTATYPLTLGGLAGALLAGIGGARLLTREVDRRFMDVTEARLVELVDDLRRARQRRS